MKSEKTKFFAQEPVITWKAFCCPVCDEPCGPQNECYKIKSKEASLLKKKAVVPKMGMISVFSENCFFRKNVILEAELNYPVSLPLVNALANIKGVENVIPFKKYAFQLVIANNFNVEEIKKLVTVAYKNFIKQLQVTENMLYEKLEITQSPLNSIKLPNGQKLQLNNANAILQTSTLRQIIADFPESQGFFEKNVGKQGSDGYNK